MDSISQRLVDAALSIPGLDAVADVVAGAANGIYGSFGTTGRRVKDAINGTWLGHPIHPAVTDVPVGAWTAAAVLDAFGERRAARLAIGLGLAGGVVAAISGLTDWLDTYGRPRRLGVVHATLNVVATGLYTWSFIERRTDERAGVAVSTIGYAIVGVSALFGGVLALDMQIGVNHTQGAEPPAHDVDVAALADIPDGGMRRVDAAGYAVLLTRRGEEVCAIAAVCAHQGGPLEQGTLEGDIVTCPWHGSQFCVRDGTVVRGPSTYPQPVFATRVAGDRVFVRAMQPA